MNVRRGALIAMAAAIVAAVALALVTHARDRDVPPLTREEIARLTDPEILRPSREIELEEGKAPQGVRFCQKRGLAYVACLGRRLFEVDAPPLSSSEVSAFDVRTGRLTRRVAVDQLRGCSLSPNERYLTTTSSPVHITREDPMRTRIGVYDAEAFPRQLRSIEIPGRLVSGFPDNMGAVYITGNDSRTIERRTDGRIETIVLDREFTAFHFGLDGRSLYVGVWGWGQGNEPDHPTMHVPPPASVLLLDPDTVKPVQTLDLTGRIAAHNLALWKNANSLVALSDAGIIDVIPMGEEGRLLAPRPIIDLRQAMLAPRLCVDEKRSYAYCMANHDRRTVVYVVDLQGRELLGGVTVSTDEWTQPLLTVSPTTDELWITTDPLDQVPIYRLDDLVKRARATGKPRVEN